MLKVRQQNSSKELIDTNIGSSKTYQLKLESFCAVHSPISDILSKRTKQTIQRTVVSVSNIELKYNNESPKQHISKSQSRFQQDLMQIYQQNFPQSGHDLPLIEKKRCKSNFYSNEVDLESKNKNDEIPNFRMLGIQLNLKSEPPFLKSPALMQPHKNPVSRPTSSGSNTNVKKINIVKPSNPTTQPAGILVAKGNIFSGQQPAKSRLIFNAVSPPQEHNLKSKQLSPSKMYDYLQMKQSKHQVGDSLINITVKKKSSNTNLLKQSVVSQGPQNNVLTVHQNNLSVIQNQPQKKQITNLSSKQATNFSRPSSTSNNPQNLSSSNKRSNDFQSPTVLPQSSPILANGVTIKTKLIQSQSNAQDALKKNVKNGKRYAEKDIQTQELQRNLKMALQQISNGNQNMLSAPPQNRIEQNAQFNNLIGDLMNINFKNTQSKLSNPTQPRSQSEKLQASKKTPIIKTKKNTTSVISTQSSGGVYNSRAGSGIGTQRQHDVKISKPTFNVQINNNVSNIGGQQAQQNSMLDPVQLVAAVQAAAQLGISQKQTKRAGSEDNAIVQLQKQKIRNQQEQSTQQNKNRKNVPSLAGSESRDNSKGSKNRSSIQVNQAPIMVAQQSSSSLANLNEYDGAVGIKVDDSQIVEREKLIAYMKNYITKKNELPPTTLEFYRFVKLIGKGAFGKVTLGVHKLTGNQVAIKTIEKSFMKDEFSKRKVFQEVYLLKKIKHSNVIRLLEVFESPKHLLIVMEYAGGGDLLRLIKRRGKLDETDSKYIFKQIVYGMAHIHCRSVIHRDIKLDNILLDSEKGVKICDFGVSKIIKKGEVIKEQCGTPAYLAPEIIIDQGYEGFFVDVWSLGVLLFAMLLGTVPFKASNLEELHKLIIKGEFSIPEEISADAQSLIRRMIQLDPKARLSVPEILAHPWLKETNEDDSQSEEAQEDQEGEEEKKNEADPELQKIQGNVNYVNVDNLFYHGNYKQKLSYTDYCCVTEDFATQNIDEEAIKVCENFGYPRQFLIKCLNRGDINHATACYFLLTNAC